MAKMKLEKVVIGKYKSYTEQQEVKINEKITTFVGKNESGKTAFLEAISKVNYFEQDDKFKLDSTIDYPRKELAKFKKNSKDEFSTECTFSLSNDFLEELEEELGEDVINFTDFTYTTYYKDRNTVNGIKANEKKYLDGITDYYISNPTTDIKEITKIDHFVKYIQELGDVEDKSEYQEALNKINTTVNTVNIESWNDKLASHIYKKFIQPNIPKFWYYDEYYELPSRININNLNSQQLVGELNKETIKTSKALFEMAGIDLNELLSSSNFESFLAELEATSNSITDDIFEYWTTNQDLEIKFEIETLANKQKVLDIRVRNNKHRVTIPLRNRSKGFNWFFSFIIWFSKIQSEDDNYILLLDEPGLNLHASAQEDLLRFINDLSNKYQIIYTTHSPFMIDSNSLDSVRTVYDTDKGTIISETIQEKDPDTLFPLQAALGYDIAQNLFISKNNLLVEGPADLLFLTAISSILEEQNKEFLNDKITIVPVGGLDKVTSFISLLRGTKLNIVCLLDSFNSNKGKQKLDNLISSKIIKDKNIMFFDEFTDYDKSDIEDLFTKKEYIDLFNKCFKDKFAELNESKFNDEPILSQINKELGIKRFNHYLPAKEFTKNNLNLSEVTINRFSELFTKINKLFK